MVDIPLSGLAALLKPFVQASFALVRQLREERQAGQVSFQRPATIMDSILNTTLDRLRGGNIDDVVST